MKIICFLFLVILWSSSSFPAEEICYNTNPYVQLPGYSYEVKEETKIVKNLPKVRSQDSIGACTGFASWVLAQHYLCAKKGVSDCANPPPDIDISPYSLLTSTYSANLDNSKVSGPKSETIFGGNTEDNLESLIQNGVLMPESCMSSDQIANKFPDSKTNQKIQFHTENLIKDYYLKMLELKKSNKNNKSSTEGGICTECIVNEIQKSYGVSIVKEDLRKSFEKYNENFRMFLDYLLFKKCEDNLIDMTDYKMRTGQYPEKFKLGYKYDPKEALVKIKEQLDNDIPVAINAICACKYEKSNKCGGHSVAVVGHKTVCKNYGSKDSCRTLIKVQNSYGKEWQENNNDGWVDAETILSKIDPEDINTNPRRYSRPIISWLY